MVVVYVMSSGVKDIKMQLTEVTRGALHHSCILRDVELIAYAGSWFVCF